jgi:hypothetical protein
MLVLLGCLSLPRADAQSCPGSDFYFGYGDGRNQGQLLYNRALVHIDRNGWTDNLVINFDGDFEGGVVIEGPRVDVFGAMDVMGSVGIGTKTPVGKFDVAGGDALFEQMLYVRHIEGKGWNDQSVRGDLYLQFINCWSDIVFNNGKMIFRGASGNLGIGTMNPTEKLAVNGRIRAKEVIVDTTGWSDYVFAKDYKLAPLSDVAQYIEQEGRLPGVPSAQKVAEEGVSLGDMQAILLAKIEELTLHVIQQEKRIQAVEAENANLKARLK